MGAESLLLYNVCVVSGILKVGAVEFHTVGCLKVLADSTSRSSG